MSIRVPFKITKNQVKDNITTVLEISIKVVLKKVKNMVLAKFSLQMGTNMKECGKMDKNMEKEHILGVVEICMREVFGWIKEKVMEFFIIMLEGDMKDTGRMIRKKGKEFSSRKIGQPK